jgi:hypothetical protein
MGIDAKVIAAVLLLAVFSAYSYFLYDLGGDNRENAIAVQQAKDQAAAQERANKAASENARRKQEREARERAREEEVNAYVETDAARAECFDADGYELFNGAGSAVHVPGGRHARVPPRPAQGAREHAGRDPAGAPR